MAFVKPGAVIQDKRSEADKDKFLHQRSMQNFHHIAKQLAASGHSLEDVICAAAKSAFGVNITPHAPKDGFAPAGNPFPADAEDKAA